MLQRPAACRRPEQMSTILFSTPTQASKCCVHKSVTDSLVAESDTHSSVLAIMSSHLWIRAAAKSAKSVSAEKEQHATSRTKTSLSRCMSSRVDSRLRAVEVLGGKSAAMPATARAAAALCSPSEARAWRSLMADAAMCTCRASGSNCTTAANASMAASDTCTQPQPDASTRETSAITCAP